MAPRATRREGRSRSPATRDPARRGRPRGTGERSAGVPAILQAIARTAARLCDASFSYIWGVESDHLRLLAVHGSLPTFRRVGQEVPLTARLPSTRSVLTRRVVHVRDATSAAARRRFPGLRETPASIRAVLAAPLLHGGAAIGVILIRARRARAFGPAEIALLRAFADQAAIALENERLREALAERNLELKESLERETATGEILRVISSSPTDLQPALDTIARRARRLCAAEFCQIFRLEAGQLHFVADDGHTAEALAVARSEYPRPPDRGHAAGRAVLVSAIVEIPDVHADPEYVLGHVARAVTFRSIIAVPMLRDGQPIGVICVARSQAGRFPERQVEILRTFADQAVIAVENVRLFTELDARNKDLSEALEQQTATSEILRVISSSPTDVQPVFDTIAERAQKLCAAHFALVSRVDGDLIHLVSLHGMTADTLEAARRPFPLPRWTSESVTARTVRSAAVVHLPDIFDDPSYDYKDTAQATGWRGCLGVPMIRDGDVIGAIFVSRSTPWHVPDRQVELLKTFADQAVIAIENIRLFTELEGRNKDLTEALEQQTATSEILRVISSSPTDVQPVFDTIAASALRLCGATWSAVTRYDGEILHLAAHHNVGDPGQMDALARAFPRRPHEGGATDRAILTCAIAHVTDVQDPGYDFGDLARATGYRSILAVPMIRDGQPLGSIAVTGAQPKAFSPRQVALLGTFADQAVIAIENVRLFQELQARTRELTRSVEELQALSAVSRTVSSTLDLPTVLSTIVSRAVQLAGAAGGVIYAYEEDTQEFELQASHRMPEELLEVLRSAPLRLGEGATGQAALRREPFQVPDISEERAYGTVRLRTVLLGRGYRSLLAVPLLSEQRILGVLTVWRHPAGRFPEEVVNLLQTFAGQSALAIQNARLFRELEAKSRELEVASRHKSEFLANMSHELRTPLNAVIGYSEMLEEEARDQNAEAFIPDLQRINAAGKHLLELINAVLDLSKIEAGKMDLYLESFEVAPLVRDVGAVLEPLAQKNGNRLEIRCEPDVGAMRADLTKLRQALFNLLSNACKFTERGVVALAVAREPGPDGDTIVFAVSDTGIGMTPEQMDRLFQEFAQADASTTRRFGGTGLGLALSRRLCRMMGGDIQVASEAGRGSTFTIRLPAEVREPSRSAGPPTPPQAATAGAGTVLVIDDDAQVRDLMTRFLGKEGFRVVAAGSGEEGLRLAQSVRPDVVTLDVLMPGMDGWSVLTALKADDALAEIPVVMLTMLDDRNLGYALGAADYLTKPIDRERLVAVLARYRPDLPVLVVDDDPDFRALARRILEREGYQVVEAVDGRVALDRLRDTTPGVILLDLMMPEMDGFDFVTAVRAEAAWRTLPIVIVTAKDLTPADRERLNGYVTRILQKGALSRDVLLGEVKDLVAASARRARERR